MTPAQRDNLLEAHSAAMTRIAELEARCTPDCRRCLLGEGDHNYREDYVRELEAERDQLLKTFKEISDEHDRVDAQNALLLKALADAVENAEIQRRGGIADPELIVYLARLCDKHGYGNVMTTVSVLWREKDPVGAFACGPCIGTIDHFLGLAALARIPEAKP